MDAMPSPLLSVLMPVRNGAATLAEALDSLAAQTIPQWEMVAVDDGSSDGTWDILSAAAQGDPRIRVFRQQHLGVSAALQHACREARGDLLSRLDADDAMQPGRLAREVEALAGDPSAALVTCQVAHHPATPPGLGMTRYLDWVNGLATAEATARERFVESPIVHPAVTMRRAAFEGAGGYRDMGWAEDYDLWLRLLGRGERFVRLAGEPLYLWRDHPRRASRGGGAYDARAMLRCRAWHLVHGGPLGDGRPFIIRGAGTYGRALLRELELLGRWPSLMIDIDPSKIGRELRPLHGSGPSVRVAATGELPRAGGTVLLGAVGSKVSDEPRRIIREQARQAGYREGEDFFACA